MNPLQPNHYVRRIKFANGYTASIVSHNFSYGGRTGLFEVATFIDDELVYDNPVVKGDVLGYLDFAEVAAALDAIAALPPVAEPVALPAE
jgi:hypothetical protein